MGDRGRITHVDRLPADDADRFSLIRDHLYTPVVGDVLDQLGLFHQFLPPELRGINPSMTIIGRAMPVLIADVYGPQVTPFGRLTEALDQLVSGDVYLAKSALMPCAAWGEILTAAAKARGGVGAVIDGYHRDTRQIVEQDWPVFSRGGYAQDSAVRSSVLDFRIPIEICGVAIAPGDLIFGDIDGVLVVPASVEEEVLERALEKATAELAVRTAIESGMSATDALNTFGVL